VIVGLGGTGKEVVALIREYLIDQYGSLAAIPIVAFVVIDTDTADPEAENRSAIPRQIHLQPNERVDASIPDIGVIWRERENLPHLRDWLPPNLEGIGHVSQGAKQIRALGRLAFFHNYQSIRKAFVEARNKVVNTDNAVVMTKQGIDVDPDHQNDPEYYLVASLAGGTGAGMFLDVAFLLKQLDHREDESPVTGFLAMPDVFEDCSVGRVRPNAYAALKELNYFTYSARDRDTNEYLDPRYEGNSPWEIQYAQGGTARAVMPPPFRYCYLVGMQNDSVRFTTDKRQDFFEMLAHNIVLDFSSAFGEYKRSARDNPGDGFMSPDDRGLPQSFCSFGLSSLRFPRKSVLNACACRLCASVFRLWSGKLRGQPTELIARLLASGGKQGSPFVQLEAWRNNHRDRLARERPTAEQTCSRLLASIQELQENTRDDGSGDASQWGPWLRALESNAQRQFREIWNLVDQKISELLDDAYGPEGVAVFLDRLENRLETFRSELERQLEDDSRLTTSLEQRHNSMQAQLTRIEGLTSAWVFAKKEVVAGEAERFLSLAKQRYEAVIGMKAVELGERLLARLTREIHTLSDQMMELLTYLEEQQERFDRYTEEWTARAASQMVNGISLYEGPDTVDQCYERSIPAEREMELARRLAKEMLEDLQTGVSGLMRIPRLELRQELLERARGGYFEQLSEISAAEILVDKTEVERERLLKQVYDRSEPFIRIIRQTPGFHSNDMLRNYFVGIHGGQDSSDQNVQQIVPLLSRLPNLTGTMRALPKSANDEIIIGQEVYTFPLRTISEMSDLQADYKRYLSDVAEFPLHIHRRWEERLPDPVPVPVEIEREARQAATLGLALGLIRPPEVGGTKWIYEYVGEAGLTETAVLSAEQDFGMLWRSLAEDDEVRPRLLDDIEAVAREAIENGTEAQLRARLDEHLSQLSERYGPLAVAYKEQHDEISSFITEHDLAPDKSTDSGDNHGVS